MLSAPPSSRQGSDVVLHLEITHLVGPIAPGEEKVSIAPHLLSHHTGGRLEISGNVHRAQNGAWADVGRHDFECSLRDRVPGHLCAQ
jgi:hypothetical protein